MPEIRRGDLRNFTEEELFELQNQVNQELANRYPFSVFTTHQYPREDEVNVVVREMPSIPAGANPFNHDTMNMGAELARGWYVMYSGDNSVANFPFRGLYLVNINSGQRIDLTFVPKNLNNYIAL